jgi:hypothetical protein
MPSHQAAVELRPDQTPPPHDPPRPHPRPLRPLVHAPMPIRWKRGGLPRRSFTRRRVRFGVRSRACGTAFRSHDENECGGSRNTMRVAPAGYMNSLPIKASRLPSASQPFPTPAAIPHVLNQDNARSKRLMRLTRRTLQKLAPKCTPGRRFAGTRGTRPQDSLGKSPMFHAARAKVRFFLNTRGCVHESRIFFKTKRYPEIGVTPPVAVDVATRTFFFKMRRHVARNVRLFLKSGTSRQANAISAASRSTRLVTKSSIKRSITLPTREINNHPVIHPSINPDCTLELGTSLVIGAWSLVIPLRGPRTHPTIHSPIHPQEDTCPAP